MNCVICRRVKPKLNHFNVISQFFVLLSLFGLSQTDGTKNRIVSEEDTNNERRKSGLTKPVTDIDNEKPVSNCP